MSRMSSQFMYLDYFRVCWRCADTSPGGLRLIVRYEDKGLYSFI